MAFPSLHEVTTVGVRPGAAISGIELRNALTVDVEDYYQVSAFEGRVSRNQWAEYPSRVAASTRKLLSLFDVHQVKATFFVLGWVAEQLPELVMDIHDRGHEIGSHSYWHRMVHTLTPEEFRADLRRSKDVLEQVTGTAVCAYRAPSFSITARSMWALDILAEEGFTIDSSIYPVRHDRYGIPGAAVEPHYLQLSAGPLLEFPPSVMPLGRYRLPVAGGGYFRLYPKSLTHLAVRRCNESGLPFMFYIHPWEVDPEQPRIAGVGWKSRARHYVNLRHTGAKLNWLLGRVRFGSIGEVMRQPAWRATSEAGITAPLASAGGDPSLAALRAPLRG
jgi:polysaccharide deacetylase family protein (PEP-CTERM system associated)